MIDIKDIDYMPNIQDIDELIGLPLFMQFYNELIKTYNPICKIEYSKDSLFKGWNIKFRKAGKGLCVIYPREKYFKVLVVVGKKEKESVEDILPHLSKEIQDIYYSSKEGMGQRWLMIDIDNDNEVYQDVLKLISIRRLCK